MTHAAIPAHLRDLVRPTAHVLPGVLLVVLLAVANATPVEQIHLKGFQDGGDYDNLIQPLVLLLAGLPVTPVPVLTPLRPSPLQLTFAAPADLPGRAGRAGEPRAPPLQ